MLRRTFVVSALAAAACPLSYGLDPEWPVRPIRLIVPGGPGGVLDIRARWIAERLGPALGQSVFVDTRPGAAGNMGTALAARSSPDGYTLVVIHQGTMAINPHLYSRIGYDPWTDLAPIARLGEGPLLLGVNPAVNANTVHDLMRLAKAAPGTLAFGSPGIGTPPHLAGELFKRAAGIDVLHVPYKGGGQAVNDLVSGHIQYSIEGLNVQLPQVQAGRLRAIAVTASRRLAILPDVPTMIEEGLPAASFVGWVGIAAPAATPRPILSRLYREIAAALATDEAHAWFSLNGADLTPETPEAFTASIRAEHAKFGKLIREIGLRVDQG